MKTVTLCPGNHRKNCNVIVSWGKVIRTDVTERTKVVKDSILWTSKGGLAIGKKVNTETIVLIVYVTKIMVIIVHVLNILPLK